MSVDRERSLKFETAGLLGKALVGALFMTTRVQRIGAEHYARFRREGKPVIFVFWHGQLLPLVHYHRREGIVVLVSEHSDGEYITRIIERNGFGTVRGSSRRGATKGLKGLVRAARAGNDLALTPDGPKGPRGVFKPGALAAAQLTGLPIIPLAVGASSGGVGAHELGDRAGLERAHGSAEPRSGHFVTWRSGGAGHDGRAMTGEP